MKQLLCCVRKTRNFISNHPNYEFKRFSRCIFKWFYCFYRDQCFYFATNVKKWQKHCYFNCLFIFAKWQPRYDFCFECLPTIRHISLIKNAPIVASSKLSCISILITCAIELSTGVRVSINSKTWSKTLSSHAINISNRSLLSWNRSGCVLIRLFLSNVCNKPFCVYLKTKTKNKLERPFVCLRKTEKKPPTVFCLCSINPDKSPRTTCRNRKRSVYRPRNPAIWLCRRYRTIWQWNLFSRGTRAPPCCDSYCSSKLPQYANHWLIPDLATWFLCGTAVRYFWGYVLKLNQLASHRVNDICSVRFGFK